MTKVAPKVHRNPPPTATPPAPVSQQGPVHILPLQNIFVRTPPPVTMTDILSASQSAPTEPIHITLRDVPEFLQPLVIAYVSHLIAERGPLTGRPATMVLTVSDIQTSKTLPPREMTTNGKAQLLADLMTSPWETGYRDAFVASLRDIIPRRARDGTMTLQVGQTALKMDVNDLRNTLRRRDGQALSWAVVLQEMRQWITLYIQQRGAIGREDIEDWAARTSNPLIHIAAAQALYPGRTLVQAVEDHLQFERSKIREAGWYRDTPNSDPLFSEIHCGLNGTPCDVLLDSALLYLDVLREQATPEAQSAYIRLGLREYAPAVPGPVAYSSLGNGSLQKEEAHHYAAQMAGGEFSSRRLEKLPAPLHSLLAYGQLPMSVLIDTLITPENVHYFEHTALESNQKLQPSEDVRPRGLEKVLINLTPAQLDQVVRRIAAMVPQNLYAAIDWCAILDFIPEVRLSPVLGGKIFAALKVVTESGSSFDQYQFNKGINRIGVHRLFDETARLAFYWDMNKMADDFRVEISPIGECWAHFLQTLSLPAKKEVAAVLLGMAFSMRTFSHNRYNRYRDTLIFMEGLPPADRIEVLQRLLATDLPPNSRMKLQLELLAALNSWDLLFKALPTVLNGDSGNGDTTDIPGYEVLAENRYTWLMVTALEDPKRHAKAQPALASWAELLGILDQETSLDKAERRLAYTILQTISNLPAADCEFLLNAVLTNGTPKETVGEIARKFFNIYPKEYVHFVTAQLLSGGLPRRHQLLLLDRWFKGTNVFSGSNTCIASDVTCASFCDDMTTILERVQDDDIRLRILYHLRHTLPAAADTVRHRIQILAQNPDDPLHDALQGLLE